MEPWRRELKIDPVPSFLDSRDIALLYFVRRDLLDEEVEPVNRLWQLSEPAKLFKKQQPEGCWLSKTPNQHEAINYRLIETWKHFLVLVDKYGARREDPRTEKAAEFLFSCQTDDGDFRGFLANQYATYYTGAIMSLLIKAGYENDPRIEKGFQWLLSMRQDDGGWTVPILTHQFDGKTMYRLTSQYDEPVEPIRSMPFSHNWTGMVLRAFAAHPAHRQSDAAKNAAALLKTRFFQPDVYTSYQDAGYWIRFQYPFWWNNLVAALDSISLIDLSRDARVQAALDWLIEHQQEDGLWLETYVPGKSRETAKTMQERFWITLAICRVFKRLVV
ncbi:MAG: terpene cyclase/mutase family protein [Anaerolineales bacterium]|nr:terpene cyclase/mutase family protein [Anaerolineales bacterium]